MSDNMKQVLKTSLHSILDFVIETISTPTLISGAVSELRYSPGISGQLNEINTGLNDISGESIGDSPDGVNSADRVARRQMFAKQFTYGAGSGSEVVTHLIKQAELDPNKALVDALDAAGCDGYKYNSGSVELTALTNFLKKLRVDRRPTTVNRTIKNKGNKQIITTTIVRPVQPMKGVVKHGKRRTSTRR